MKEYTITAIVYQCNSGLLKHTCTVTTWLQSLVHHGSSVFIDSGGVTLFITYEEQYYFQYILNNNNVDIQHKCVLQYWLGHFYAPKSSLINAILVYKIITYSVYKLVLHYLPTISMQHHNWHAFDSI